MRSFATFAVLAALCGAPLHAAEPEERAGDPPAASAEAPLTQGEIRRVDKPAKKVTIRHGPIANLDMPPMTMTFRVEDADLLERVKVGDKVSFAADKKDGAYIVTELEAQR